MKKRMWVHALGSVAALLSWAASGGEVIVNENFDALKLEELKPGWTKAEPSMLSVVDEPQRGKVLKIANKQDHYAAVTYTIDPAKVAGKIVRATVAAKFPDAYAPIQEKLWASPKMLVEFKDANGILLGQADLVPQAGMSTWQDLKREFTIPWNTASAMTQVCVQFVAAEVYFDNMHLEIIGNAAQQAPVAAPPAPNPAPNVVANPPGPNAPTRVNAAGNKAPPAPPAPPPDPNSPAGRAAKAPKKDLTDDGMAFSPDHALRMQKVFELKKAAPYTIMMIGPGMSEKDASPKLHQQWKVLPLNPKLAGKSVTPRGILGALPEALAKEKPETVLIAGDDGPGRKPTSTEAEDWEDIGKLCERMGAVPVLVMPATGSKNEEYEGLVQSVKKAMDVNNFIALAAQPQDVYLRRVATLTSLLDLHVFLRGKMPEERKAGPMKPIDE